jgi:N-acetylneuraminic acid mutarotase
MKRFTDLKIALLLLVSIIAFGLTAASANASFNWTRKADMPTPRWGHSSAVVNGKIYIIGGGTSEPDLTVLSTVEEYDPITDTWTRKADMPTARGWMSRSSAVVNGRIYVIGGIDGVDRLPTVEEYDPATDTWTRKANMPTPRWNLATCELNGKIYAIGGSPSTSSLTGLVVVEEYDPATDAWTRKADMPLGVWGPCANVVNGKIYAFGGRPGNTAVPNVQEYDPATDTWTRKADMLVGTSQMASVALHDKIIVIGGWYLRVPSSKLL